ncbi:MAG: DEAD/DEAH box helicase, partial [Myxococcales bacterium]|nr:DEAD/DEAH box helicase [Myxococcales bacterium]
MSAAFEPSGRNPFRQPEGIDAVIAEWEQRGRLHQMVLDQMLPAQQGDSRPFPEQLPAALRLALERRGIETLYSHQAEAYERALAGEDWVVSTPTASGKSLCYNLAVLTRMLEDESVRALYLFPTKALSRDQEEAFRQLAREAGAREGAITYDGDTPGDARRAARERAGVILTNPDMLHAAILPHHTSWARFFSKLSYVVVDELHTYRGVFGSHLANVLRRLQRVARFHG